MKIIITKEALDEVIIGRRIYFYLTIIFGASTLIFFLAWLDSVLFLNSL